MSYETEHRAERVAADLDHRNINDAANVLRQDNNHHGNFRIRERW
jgi:hypothetical protein